MASITAGAQGKPKAWSMVGINRNLTSRLGWVAPGKPMLDQAGNEPPLFLAVAPAYLGWPVKNLSQ